MSCSQFDKFLSRAAVPRVGSVNDPVLDVARSGAEGDSEWMKRYQYMEHVDKGFSNFDFSKDKFKLNEE